MARKRKSPETYERQAEEFRKKAEMLGLSENFLFSTSFDRYLTQVKILKDLEKQIEASGTIIEKINVKGAVNLAENPAVNAYAKTSSSANGTAKLLQSIIAEHEDDRPGGKLAEMLLDE